MNKAYVLIVKSVRCHVFTLNMFAGCLHSSKCIANCQYTRHSFLEQSKCNFFALLNLHWKLQTGQQDVVSFWTVSLYSTHKADFYDPLYKYTTQGFLYFGGHGRLEEIVPIEPFWPCIFSSLCQQSWDTSVFVSSNMYMWTKWQILFKNFWKKQENGRRQMKRTRGI